MSKIICDICGTAYQETAKQCPICGCVRPGDVQRITNEVKSNGKVSTGYTYVKGGRFSKSNVKKRTKVQSTGKTKADNYENNEEPKSNKGLVITAVVLLLAIIGVIAYIAIRFFAPISNPNDGASTDSMQESHVDLSCKDIHLDTDTVIFEQLDEARLLQVTFEPANTSDVPTFQSDNEAIVTVTDKGKITAVGEGTANITITCGAVTKVCAVTVQLPQESTGETVEESTGIEETVKPAEPFRLNRKDITLGYKGESWVLYAGDVAKNLITWSSDDETVAVFTDGKVVAVGGGMTEVHAEFDGQKATCIIRCKFKDNGGIAGNGGVSEDGGIAGNGGVGEDSGNTGSIITNTNYTVYTQHGSAFFDEKERVYDISISVGEKLTLTLKDSGGNVVTPTLSTQSGAVSISGNQVTGTSRTSGAKVAVAYNSSTYLCIIRVK